MEAFLPHRGRWLGGEAGETEGGYPPPFRPAPSTTLRVVPLPLRGRKAPYGCRRYPPASVSSSRAWPGSGSIFWRRR